MSVTQITLSLVSATRAADPNATPDELFNAAHNYPNEVLNNPALALISLEDPAFWQKILLAAHRTRYTQSVLSMKLDPEQTFRGMLQALEHILPEVERAFAGVGIARGVLVFLRLLQTTRLPLRRQQMLKDEYHSKVGDSLKLVRIQRAYAEKMKWRVFPATEVGELFFKALDSLFFEEPPPLQQSADLADVFLKLYDKAGLHAWIEEVEWQRAQLPFL